MPRIVDGSCDTTSSGWNNAYGTTAVGNIGQFVVGKCIEDIVDINTISSQPGLDWIRISDFRFYHIRCPYYTDTGFHFVPTGTVINGNRGFRELTTGELGSHTASSGIMIRYARSSVYGWLCVDPACPHYISTGQRYFYR